MRASGTLPARVPLARARRRAARARRMASATRGAVAAAPRRALAPRRRERAVARAGNDGKLREVFERLYPADAGKQIYFGVFKRDVGAGDACEIPSEEERARRRAGAAADLTNIDAAERGRRMTVGRAAAAATAALAAAQLALGATRLERAVIAIPLFFAIGFVGSAKTGL